MKREYQSNFKDDILLFIGHKVAMGYKESTYRGSLQRFDKMCVESFPEEKEMTKKILRKWAERKPSETRNDSYNRRMQQIKAFCLFLKSSGKDVNGLEILVPLRKQSRELVHVFTDEELTKYFQESDKIKPNFRSDFSEFILPVMLRMIYCCGLRPKEARTIKVNQINFQKKTIHIQESKNGKGRIILMPDDLVSLCRKYDCLAQRRIPGRTYFFEKANGGFFTKRWLSRVHLNICNKAGIALQYDKFPPIYNLRHTFASKVVSRWQCNNEDVMAKLPYLMTYLGHKKLENTLYYVHVIPTALLGSKLLNFEIEEDWDD